MTDPHAELRREVRRVCADFPDVYWRELDARRAYPDAFVAAMTEAGLLAAMIPVEYGGRGLDLAATAVILEEINRGGGNAQPAHAQLYTMGTVLRHGSEAQKREHLPRIASGELRLQAFGVTEPAAGTDTTSIATTARREDVSRRSDGLSTFLVDLREAVGRGLTVTPRRVMLNNLTNQLVFDGLRIPASSVIGAEGAGFRQILDGMNAERNLIAAECIGNGRWCVRRACDRAREREVFGRAIGANQGVQFPLARAHAAIEAADLMRIDAAARFDRDEPCGTQANLALLLAADPAWAAADAAVQTFGGYGLDAEYDVERKFRETRLFRIAPISTNLILAHVAEHVLGLPRSF